jgi:anti-sigma factor RsiW
MNCAQVKERLVDFLYDEMPPEARASFAEHLTSCPTCQAEVASYEHTLGKARAALSGPLSEEPPARVHFAVIEAAKAAVKQSAAPRARIATPENALGFFARLWRTPWLLPAFGAVSVATVVFLVRVLKNPEVLPGQHPHSIEERTLSLPEAVSPLEKAPAAQPAAAPATAIQAKSDLVEAKASGSAGGGNKHGAKAGLARAKAQAPAGIAPIMKMKKLDNDPLDGLKIDNVPSSGGGLPFAEPPPSRQSPAKSNQVLDDLSGLPGMESEHRRAQPPAAPTANKPARFSLDKDGLERAIRTHRHTCQKCAAAQACSRNGQARCRTRADLF